MDVLAVLGLSHERVTDADIRQAYRKLVREYHPDRLASARKSSEEIAAATARFAEIQSAYEILTGEDQSIVEVGGRHAPPVERAHVASEDGERQQPAHETAGGSCTWSPGDSLHLKGEILRVRRFGMQLTFCRMRTHGEIGQVGVQSCAAAAHAQPPVEVVFDSSSFNHAHSPRPFPAAKCSVRAGDIITLHGTWEHDSKDTKKERSCRVRVLEWNRLDSESAAVETALERLQRDGKRRTGKAAMAGCEHHTFPCPTDFLIQHQHILAAQVGEVPNLRDATSAELQALLPWRRASAAHGFGARQAVR